MMGALIASCAVLARAADESRDHPLQFWLVNQASSAARPRKNDCANVSLSIAFPEIKAAGLNGG
jgi:hypothetical protein